MIAIIQCAASKRKDAGRLVTADGTPVKFVADPRTAPPDVAVRYARPDDASDIGVSWRQQLLAYNRRGDNPLELLPAWRLYEHPVYRRLAETLGVDRVYVLSAGWGLIRSDFLTPDYDITFSQSASVYKRRLRTDRYADLQMLSDDTPEPIVLFAGKEYQPLFASLTSSVRAPRSVFYNAQSPPQLAGVRLKRFETRTRTNWQYECANAFLDGDIML